MHLKFIHEYQLAIQDQFIKKFLLQNFIFPKIICVAIFEKDF